MNAVLLTAAGAAAASGIETMALEPPPRVTVIFGNTEYFRVLGITAKVAGVTPRLAKAVAPLPPPPVTVAVTGATTVVEVKGEVMSAASTPLGALRTAVEVRLLLTRAPLPLLLPVPLRIRAALTAYPLRSR